MMYKNDFVAVVKANGKILREDKNTVLVPFGSEYSILMKNLFGRKAVVSIWIDGEEVTKSGQLIINPNSEIELERFIENLNKGNKFKFIQKTEKIQQHRGDKIDDGIVRIEFQFEKEKPAIMYQPWTTTIGAPWNDNWNYTTCNNTGTNIRDLSQTYSSTIVTDSFESYECDTPSASASSGDDVIVPQSMNVSHAYGLRSFAPKVEEGITVKGSESTQQFKYGSVGTLEDEKHVITLQLKGYTESGKQVTEALTVQTKKKCSTCGTVNKSIAKFCRECGTFLE